MSKPVPRFAIRNPDAPEAAFAVEEEKRAPQRKDKRDKLPRATIQRADGTVDARLTAYMDYDLSLRIRDYCYAEDIPMASLIRDILETAAKKLPK